jgi:Uma2 family endonuclease
MAIQVERPRRRFTVEEYERMGRAGVFGPEDRVELIHGEIIEMSPIGTRHAAAVNNLNRLLVAGLGQRAVVSPQNPVQIGSHSMPQPDLAVLRWRSYVAARPVVEDLLLLVEVSDTTLGFDRTVKLGLYMGAGVPEYWIVDVGARAIALHRRPGRNVYREVDRLTPGQSVSLGAFPDVIIPVANVFA